MIERNDYLESLISFKGKNLIRIIVGIRRYGKSTIFELYQSYLEESGVEEKQIITVNLEDGNYRGIHTPEKLYQYVGSKLVEDNKNYVFLDEVQQVENLQETADWLYMKKNVDLYITGPNTFLLPGRLTTSLSGRYIEIEMLPLSFKEYISAYPGDTNTGALYMNYLQNSPFPEALELARKQDIRVYLEGIYNTILLKGVVTRGKISDPSTLQSMAEFMFDNTGNMCPATKIANAMTPSGRKIGVPTTESYLSALYDSLILYKIGRYGIKEGQCLVTRSKYYIADIGLHYFTLGTKQVDVGHILENIVYLELIRRGYEIHIEKAGDAEIDFIVIGAEGEEYYQVSQTVLEEQTLKRELLSLDTIKDHNPKYLLTMDYTPLTSHNGIKQVNVLEWLPKKQTETSITNETYEPVEDFVLNRVRILCMLLLHRGGKVSTKWRFFKKNWKKSQWPKISQL